MSRLSADIAPTAKLIYIGFAVALRLYLRRVQSYDISAVVAILPSLLPRPRENLTTALENA